MRAGDHVGEIVGRLLGLDEPAGRTHREDLDEREALAPFLRGERRGQHSAGPGDVAGVVDGATGDVGRAAHRGDQVADEDGMTVARRVAAVERVLRALTEHGRGGDVATGLAEHAVVEQHAGDVLAAGRRVQHLLETLVDHVAVALDREHEGIGPHAFHAGRQRRGPTVQRLQHLDVEIVGERGVAADAEDRDRPFDRAELGDALHGRADGDRFAASGAQVMRPDVDQIGREVVDQRRVVGPPIGAEHHALTNRFGVHYRPPIRSSSARIRARILGASISGPTPNPDESIDSPPMNSTGHEPRRLSRTSSIICPRLFS